MSAQQELYDPATSAERLQQIAFEHPELGTRIAAHPNCYPELQQWVEQHALSTAPPKPRKLLKAVGIGAAIVLPLITAVGIVVPAIAKLGERASSLETLSVETAVDPYADAEVIGAAEVQSAFSKDSRSDWEIPVSAPIASFPLDNTPNEFGEFIDCSEAQLEWLEEHAKLGPGTGSAAFNLTLRNTSTTGASLPLGNIRFIGEEVESGPTVRFQCPTGGRGDTGGNQPLLIKVTGEESLYGEALNASGEGVMPEGSPVTLNLAPGEVSVVTLTRDASVDTQRRYEGRFIADLVDGSGETVVLAEEVTFKRAAVEGFYIGFPSGQMTADFVCLSPTVYGEIDSRGFPRPAPCTLSQAAEILREAEASSN